MHFLFASGIFQKSQPNPLTKNHIIYAISQLSSPTLRSPISLERICPSGLSFWHRLDQTHRFGWQPASTTRGVDYFARWGCFIAGMSFACLAPPHHAHHVRWLRKWVWSDGYVNFGRFLVRGVFDWFLRCGSSRQSVWPPGWLVLSLVGEIHKVMSFC